MDFIPDFETKMKYRRSSNVPDYRHTMYPVEPKYAHVPPIASTYTATNENVSRRNSDLPVFAPQVDLENGRSSRTSRRQSLGRTNGGSPGKQPRRSVSPEQGIPRVQSFPVAGRHGAVSPLSARSISPVGQRSGFVSPINRNGAVSPIATPRNGAVSPINRSNSPVVGIRKSMTSDPKAFNRQQALDQLQMRPVGRRQVQSLTLDTQMNGGRPPTSASEESEEFDEVISLSPAVRAPVKKFRRASSAMSLSAHPDGKNLMLDSILEDNNKTYFGQDVNPEDLVAVNLENAFDRL